MRGKIGYYGILVLTVSLAGRFLGLFREVVFSKYFGTTGTFDAFTIIFSVILFVAGLLNIIPFLLIPTLAEPMSREDTQEFSRQLNAILVVVFGIVFVAFILCEVWTERTLTLVAPGLKADQDTFAFALILMKVSIPIVILLAFSQLLKGLLNLHSNFLLPPLESVFLNVGVIAAVVVGWNFLKVMSPLSVPFGYYVAYAVFIAVCMAVMAKKLKLLWRVDLGAIKVVWLGVSVLLLATFLNYLNPLVLMWHASLIKTGTISGLGYVQRLVTFSVGTYVNSFLVVFLPLASFSFLKGGSEGLRMETERMVVNFLIFSLYISVLIAFNTETIVRLIYQRGAFDENSVSMVSGLFYYYIPWVIFFPLSNIAMRVMYIRKDYNVLAVITAVGLTITLSLAPVLRRMLGLNGLGLMSSLHMMALSIMLLIALHVRHFRMHFRGIWRQLSPQAGVVTLMAVLLMVLRSFVAFSALEFLFVSALLLGGPFVFWLNKHFNLLGVLKKQLQVVPLR